MLDEQRSLIRLVFADLKLDEGKLSYTYSKTFKIFSEAVAATNGSNVYKMDDLENGKFELSKNGDVTGQKGSFSPSRPIWLPLKDLFCNYKIKFDMSLNDLKIAFESLRLNDTKFALITY
jgi:hypothetical protein